MQPAANRLIFQLNWNSSYTVPVEPKLGVMIFIVLKASVAPFLFSHLYLTERYDKCLVYQVYILSVTSPSCTAIQHFVVKGLLQLKQNELYVNRPSQIINRFNKPQEGTIGRLRILPILTFSVFTLRLRHCSPKV